VWWRHLFRDIVDEEMNVRNFVRILREGVVRECICKNHKEKQNEEN